MKDYNVHLVLIDPQNDFTKEKGPNGERGALVVPGGDGDMCRLGKFIKKNKRRIKKCSVTLDSHQKVHIAHPIAWKDKNGNRPDPFTVITSDDVRSGKWMPFNPSLQNRFQNYVDCLKSNGRYELRIWNPHCLIATWGAAVADEVISALYEWEEDYNRVSFIPKGNNPWTEHYSAITADVPDVTDDTTKLNVAFIDTLKDADEIVFAAEALTHCVKYTMQDIADYFGPEYIKKFTLLIDATSPVPVPGYERIVRDFLDKMTKLGMKVCKTTDW